MKGINIKEVIENGSITKTKFKKKVLPILLKNPQNTKEKLNMLVEDLWQLKFDNIQQIDIMEINKVFKDLGKIKPIKKLKQVESKKATPTAVEDFKVKYEEMLKKNIKLELRLNEQNKILMDKIKLTDKDLIIVSDENINMLYVNYMTDKNNKEYNDAFITENNIIPKSYYSLKE